MTWSFRRAASSLSAEYPRLSTTNAFGLTSSLSSAWPTTAASIQRHGGRLYLGRRNADATDSACQRGRQTRSRSSRRYLSPLSVHGGTCPRCARCCSSKTWRWSARNLQLADLPAAGPPSSSISHFISGNGLAGRAIAHVAGPIRQKNMQNFGRSYPVENIDAEALGPAPPDIERECFAGNHIRVALTHPSRQVRAAHCGEEGRHAVEIVG